MKRVVLLVEDRPEIRKLIGMALDYDEFEIHEAETGPQALAILESTRPDIALLDVMLPGGMNGYQICERIRANPELAEIPVVMISACAQQSDIVAGKRAGCTAYLTKPFSPMQLIETVEGLVSAARDS